MKTWKYGILETLIGCGQTLSKGTENAGGKQQANDESIRDDGFLLFFQTDSFLSERNKLDFP